MYKKRYNNFKIVSLFRNNYNSRFYLRQISKLTELNLRTCQNTLKKLESSNVLKSKLEGKNKYFYLNLKNINTKYLLLQAEIYQTNKFIEEYKKIKLFLKSIKGNTPLIVFGSFAKFKATKNSDLDMLVISDKSTKLPTHLLSLKVHEIKMPEKTFFKALKNQEELIKEIEDNHIILNNHSFYVNSMWDHYAK